MAQISTIFFLDIGSIHMEAVLDGGFWNTFSHVADIHYHSYYELMLCPQGTYCIHAGKDATISMETDDLCLIPPRCYHRLSGEDATRKLAIRFFCTRNLKPDAVYQAFSAAMEDKTDPISLGKRPEILQLARQLSQELQQQPLAAETYAESLLTQLLIQVMRLVCSPQTSAETASLPNQTSARRLAIEEHLNTHYAENLTEEGLAAILHLSKRQLSRVLQQFYGMSFRQLLIDLRLNQAALLLSTTKLSPEEVAYQVGYTSLSGFYEAFRKRYGMSAGRYQRQLYK